MSITLKMLALMALAFSLGSNAMAETYHGFVKDPYYIGRGGTVVSPKDFAANPTKYTRSDVVYLTLREHFSRVVGKPLGDAEFRTLLASGEVRLTDCVGRIKTAGVTSQGKIAWHERACYKNEKLIEVQVPGGWMVAASQGCYNPVEGVRPAPPKVAVPTLEDGVCGPAAGTYSATDTALRGDLCTAGYPTSFVTLPRPGISATYSCFPRNGGKLASCPISVQAEARPLPTQSSAPVPRTPSSTTSVIESSVSVSGLSTIVVPTCNGVVAVGGTPAINFRPSPTSALRPIGGQRPN
jgi:hypothetical protein